MSLPAMTNIRLVCPECGARLRILESVPAGKKVKCPRCRRRFDPGAPDDTKRSHGPDRQADSLALAEQVDSLCDRFEDALRAGKAGDWWDWLPVGPARARALAELARLDLEHRLRQ